METPVDFRVQRKQAALTKLNHELQMFCKRMRSFFDLLESDNYSLRMLVASFLDKIKMIFKASNPIEIVIEFDKWLKFFAIEKTKLCDTISAKINKDIEYIPDVFKVSIIFKSFKFTIFYEG